MRPGASTRRFWSRRGPARELISAPGRRFCFDCLLGKNGRDSLQAFRRYNILAGQDLVNWQRWENNSDYTTSDVLYESDLTTTESRYFLKL
jgi:hypothetical protein